MLEAIAGRRALELAYGAALEGGYRWHEFGDVHLILPRPRTQAVAGRSLAGARSLASDDGSDMTTTRPA